MVRPTLPMSTIVLFVGTGVPRYSKTTTTSVKFLSIVYLFIYYLFCPFSLSLGPYPYFSTWKETLRIPPGVTLLRQNRFGFPPLPCSYVYTPSFFPRSVFAFIFPCSLKHWTFHGLRKSGSLSGSTDVTLFTVCLVLSTGLYLPALV